MAARAERPRRVLSEYTEAIVELRDAKGYSFREIAEWFGQNVPDVEVDHNMVYRVYSKSLSYEQN
tara:strand:+ start:132 stop:326 length:195 start_codon:yes stop_codon:yes gene_type:complete